MAEKTSEELRAWVDSEIDRRGLKRTADTVRALVAEAASDTEKPKRSGTKWLPSSAREMRPGIITGTSLIGGALGAPAGPMGIIGGSALGAAGGSVLADAAESSESFLTQGGSKTDLMRRLLIPPATQEGALSALKGAGGVGTRALGEAALDVTALGMGEAGSMVLRRGLRMATGFGAKAEGRMMDASTVGVPVGLQEVSENAVIRGAQMTLGQFPLINKPYITAVERKALALTGESGRGGAFENLLFSVGPVASLADVGIRITNSSDAAFKTFKIHASKQYDAAFRMAEQADARIPTESVRTQSVMTLRELFGDLPLKQRVVMRDGVQVTQKAPLDLPGSETIQKFSNELSSLEDSMTVAAYRGLGQRLSAAIDQVGASTLEGRRLIQLKKALEDDLVNISGPVEVKQALNDADRFFASGMRIFETPSAQKMRRVDKNFGRVQLMKPGTLEPDEVAKVILSSNSPQSIRSFRNLMRRAGKEGRDSYKMAIASDLATTFRAGIKTVDRGGVRIEITNTATIRNKLGIGRPRSPEFHATIEKLRGTGVSIVDIEKLIEVSDLAFAEGIPNLSEFIKRRTALSGARALATSFVPTALGTRAGQKGTSKTKAVIAAGLFVFGGRWVGNALTDPAKLRALRDALDPRFTQAAQIRATRRLALLVPAAFAIEDLGISASETLQGIVEPDRLNSSDPFLGFKLPPERQTR